MRIHASINRMVNKEDSAIKAYASVTMDGMFAVHGLRVIETEKGRFVNMPSTSYTDKDGNKQYSDTFHAITKSARTAVNQAVLNAYDLKLQQVQDSAGRRRKAGGHSVSRRISRWRTLPMRKCRSLKMNLNRS